MSSNSMSIEKQQANMKSKNVRRAYLKRMLSRLTVEERRVQHLVACGEVDVKVGKKLIEGFEKQRQEILAALTQLDGPDIT